MDFHFVERKRAFLRETWTRDKNTGSIFHFVAGGCTIISNFVASLIREVGGRSNNSYAA